MVQLTSTIKGEDERETKVSLFVAVVDWETTGAGAIYRSLGEYRVVCHDYRHPLTRSSLVDYNNNDTVPYHILPPIFYHLQRVHFISWQVVWETTLPYITTCTTIYWEG